MNQALPIVCRVPHTSPVRDVRRTAARAMPHPRGEDDNTLTQPVGHASLGGGTAAAKPQ